MPPAAPASWPDTERIDNLPGDLVRYISGHFRALAQTQLDVIVELLNDRPRKCLGWGKNLARFMLYLLDFLPVQAQATPLRSLYIQYP